MFIEIIKQFFFFFFLIPFLNLFKYEKIEKDVINAIINLSKNDKKNACILQNTLISLLFLSSALDNGINRGSILKNAANVKTVLKQER